MKLRQKIEKKAADQSPTTSIMNRHTTGEKDVFEGRGKSEGLLASENKGAQEGKTPLGVWQGKESGSAGQGDGC